MSAATRSYGTTVKDIRQLVVLGDPGSGKSWLAIAMSATLSIGGKLPEEDGVGREPGPKRKARAGGLL
jgi:hypothetical protein